jgi:hypothetical protein
MTAFQNRGSKLWASSTTPLLPFSSKNSKTQVLEGLKSDIRKDFPDTKGIKIMRNSLSSPGDLEEQNRGWEILMGQGTVLDSDHCPPQQPSVPGLASCLDFLHRGFWGQSRT